MVIENSQQVEVMRYIKPGLKKSLLVRFLPSDISSGATDKEIFNYCNRNNWKIYFDFSFHAKTFIFDKIKCVIGSANLTNKGFGIAKVLIKRWLVFLN